MMLIIKIWFAETKESIEDKKESIEDKKMIEG